MDIFDSEGSVRYDITEAVESIFRYIEKCPYKGVYPATPPDALGIVSSCPVFHNLVSDPQAAREAVQQ